MFCISVGKIGLAVLLLAQWLFQYFDWLWLESVHHTIVWQLQFAERKIGHLNLWRQKYVSLFHWTRGVRWRLFPTFLRCFIVSYILYPASVKMQGHIFRSTLSVAEWMFSDWSHVLPFMWKSDLIKVQGALKFESIVQMESALRWVSIHWNYFFSII